MCWLESVSLQCIERHESIKVRNFVRCDEADDVDLDLCSSESSEPPRRVYRMTEHESQQLCPHCIRNSAANDEMKWEMIKAEAEAIFAENIRIYHNMRAEDGPGKAKEEHKRLLQEYSKLVDDPKGNFDDQSHLNKIRLASQALREAKVIYHHRSKALWNQRNETHRWGVLKLVMSA